MPNDNNVILVPMTEIEARELVEEIKIGISTVGQKLLELYEREGWRALGYANWRDCVMAEFDFQQSHVYRLLDFARVERNLSPIGGNYPLPTNERQGRALVKLEPEVQRQAWQKAVDTAPQGKVTAKHVETVVRGFRAENFHVEVEPDSFTCPRCGERRVKLNGGALCLNDACGAKWSSRVEFDEELQELEQEIHLLRADLKTSVISIINRLPPDQLKEFAAVLADWRQ